MPFWRSYAHIVWATKNRQPLILPGIEKDMYAYLVSKTAEMGCYVHAINGVEDHIHLVISIPPKHSVAWVVKTLKGAGSHCVNYTLRPYEDHFDWQRGYGYLTLGESQCPRAVSYVAFQKERHQKGEINGWLERYSDLDEGPAMPESNAPQVATDNSLHEQAVVYDSLQQPPF